MAKIQTYNPYDGSELASYKSYNKDEVKEILETAEKQFLNWRETSFSHRKQLILAVAKELKSNKLKYAEAITAEMGKPITQAIAEIEKCAWVCEYYADEAEDQLKNEVIKTDARKSYISYEPLGVILAIMPWNYPFWQVFRFAIPTLMAGNVGILKHASNVAGSALNIEKVFREAGLPNGCFTTLLVSGKNMQPIIENPIIKAVTLTGSGPAGASVAGIAGNKIKKTVLELGGNNALIALKDCNIDETVEICVQARFQNTGQSCIAGKRLFVAASIHDEFLEKLIKKVRELKSGDPSDEHTFIGTMATEELAEELENQVSQTIKDGGKLEIGGKRVNAYFEPTVVSGVTPEMPMFKEETFGPALSVTAFKDFDEAVALSNNSKFGLGVSIFTSDIKTAEKNAYRFNEGAVFINSLVKSDPRLPFGGVKESGYGRELSAHGIREFLNKKTVYIQ